MVQYLPRKEKSLGLGEKKRKKRGDQRAGLVRAVTALAKNMSSDSSALIRRLTNHM